MLQRKCKTISDIATNQVLKKGTANSKPELCWQIGSERSSSVVVWLNEEKSVFLLFQKVLDPSFPQLGFIHELLCHPSVMKYFTTPL